MEINQNINDAFDYAVKKTTSSYNSGLSGFTSTVNNSESMLHDMMLIFNEAFKKSINLMELLLISVYMSDTDNMLIDHTYYRRIQLWIYESEGKNKL